MPTLLDGIAINKWARMPALGIVDTVAAMRWHRILWVSWHPQAEIHEPFIWRAPDTYERGLDGLEHLFPRPALVPAPIWEPDVLKIEEVTRPAVYVRRRPHSQWQEAWNRLLAASKTGKAVRLVFDSRKEEAACLSSLWQRVRKANMKLRTMQDTKSQEEGRARIIWFESKNIPEVAEP